MVTRQTRQQLSGTLSVLAVLAFAMLPDEHIHFARTHDGHHSDVVHRHFEPHHPEGPQPAVDHSDDDQDVQWLRTSFIGAESAGYICQDNQMVEGGLSATAPEPTRHRTVQALFVSVHAPPWSTPSGLRAPPTLDF
jgi:hypothetical protein